MMIAVTTHDAPTRAPRLPPMEHRWGERVACGTPVTLHMPDGVTHRAVLRDVSMSGGFVEIAVPPRPLTRLTLSVSAVDAGRGAGIDIEAVVVRVTAGGVGIEWYDTPQGSFCTLLGCAQRCRARSQPLCTRFDT